MSLQNKNYKVYDEVVHMTYGRGIILADISNQHAEVYLVKYGNKEYDSSAGLLVSVEMNNKNISDCKILLQNTMNIYKTDLLNAYIIIKDKLIAYGAKEKEIIEAYNELRSGVNV